MEWNVFFFNIFFLHWNGMFFFQWFFFMEWNIFFLMFFFLMEWNVYFFSGIAPFGRFHVRSAQWLHGIWFLNVFISIVFSGWVPLCQVVTSNLRNSFWNASFKIYFLQYFSVILIIFLLSKERIRYVGRWSVLHDYFAFVFNCFKKIYKRYLL